MFTTPTALRRLAALCLPIALSAACVSGEAPNFDGGSGGQGGSGTVDDYFASSSGDGMKSCGEVELTTNRRPSRLLILLDRSCSMNHELPVSEDSKISKWLSATDVLQNLAKQSNQPELALSFFPAQSRGGETVDIGFGPQSNHDVAGALAAASQPDSSLYPGNPCCTPIDRATLVANEYAALRAQGYAGHVALVTDGSQVGCGSEHKAGGINGAIERVGSMHQDEGIRTFVVGFGKRASKSQLNKLAEAGGAALAPDEDGRVFYRADNPDELTEALQNISEKSISCVVGLDGVDPLPKPEKLNVKLAGESVAHDSDNGWAYTKDGELELFGAACDHLRQGKELQVVALCEDPR